MRILFASDNYLPVRGGLIRSMCGLAEELISRGDEVRFVVPAAPISGTVSCCYGLVPTVQIVGRPIPLISYRPVVLPRFAARAISQVIAEWSPNVVHVMTPFSVGHTAIRLAKQTRIPTILAIHLLPDNAIAHSAVGRIAPSIPAAILKAAYRRCARTADLIVAPTHTASAYARQTVGDRAITTISNGVSRLPRHSDRNNTKQGSEHLKVLYVGRLSREKRIDVLLMAFKEASTSIDMSLIIVGDGPDRERLHRIASRTCMDRVRFTGFVTDDDLARYYESSDIFCMPSPAELECVAALEALSYGLPIVAPQARALAELAAWSGAVKQYQSAHSPRQLAECLRQLAADNMAREAMAYRAIEASRERSISATVNQWRIVYNQIRSDR